VHEFGRIGAEDMDAEQPPRYLVEGHSDGQLLVGLPVDSDDNGALGSRVLVRQHCEAQCDRTSGCLQHLVSNWAQPGPLCLTSAVLAQHGHLCALSGELPQRWYDRAETRLAGDTRRLLRDAIGDNF
jgi:hypothetical protein